MSFFIAINYIRPSETHQYMPHLSILSLKRKEFCKILWKHRNSGHGKIPRLSSNSEFRGKLRFPTYGV